MHTKAYKSIQKHTNAYKTVSSDQLDQDRTNPALSQPCPASSGPYNINTLPGKVFDTISYHSGNPWIVELCHLYD